MEDIQQLCHEWMALKEQEKAVMEARREVEDLITRRLEFTDLKANATKVMEGFKISATCRKDVKVDAQHVREIAAANEINNHLGHLFGWTAKVNLKEWKKADPAITNLLGEAVTESFSKRLGYKIELIG